MEHRAKYKQVLLLLILGCTFYYASAQSISQQIKVQVTSLTDTIIGAVGEVERDQMGNLFVADFGQKVWYIYPNGSAKVFNNTMYGASGNTLDAQGNVIQSQFYGNTIVKLNRYTKEVEEIAHEGLAGPVGLTYKNKELYVCNCNNNTIAKIENGKAVQFSKSPLFNCPNGIITGPKGNLYVVNFNNPNIVKIDSAGNATLFAALPTTSGGHIDYDQGYFYVTSFKDHKIFRVSYFKQKVSHFAGTGTKGVVNGEGHNAQFSNPNGIEAYQGNLYINDKIVDPKDGITKFVIRKVTFPHLLPLLNQASQVSLEEVKKVYQTYKEYPSFKDDDTEAIINRLGYVLINRKQYDMAVSIFEMNTESYPASWNVWDSLAEAYMLKGEKDKSIQFYYKSLELNPQNANARQKLKELESL